MAAHTAWSFCLTPEGTLFGGMFATTQAASLVKAILSLATLIVFLQAGGALAKAESSFKTGEFYMLTLSTLFGMNIMISSGHFLMFYLGLETASIPLACLVAFDKYKQNSAEAAAKYILNAALSSGILVYGLSFIYGTCGTLYFANVPSMLDMTVLQVAGLVMFLAGMGFKISLVPFHMWTPDVYQGAPTSVTAYLSVVSKGAAAFALMTVLFKVFAPMAMVWQDLMYGIIILTITLANLFALPLHWLPGAIPN
jgi:NADH-quinone oxidoreductase subunit N